MRHPSEIPDISSEEVMIEQVIKMSRITCEKKGHDLPLEKICVDDDCEKNTEQYDLECDDCEDTQVHMKKDHKTKHVIKVMKEVIKSTHEEERKQGQQQQKPQKKKVKSEILMKSLEILKGLVYSIDKGQKQLSSMR